MIEDVQVFCPYCSESFDTTIDVSGGTQEYIEDCFICCRPIVFSVTVDIRGEAAVTTRREDD